MVFISSYKTHDELHFILYIIVLSLPDEMAWKP